MTNLVAALTALSSVDRLAAWNDRQYVNFVGTDKALAGDRNLKVWIKGDVLTIEGLKGSRSSNINAALGQIVELIEASGAEKIQGHRSETEGRYKFA